MLWMIVLAGILTAADQFAKYLAVTHLAGSGGIVLIPHVLELSYVENTGAAFGMFGQAGSAVLIIPSVIILGGLTYLSARIPRTRRMLPVRVLTAVIAAGALGNLIDRIIRRCVVDFIYVSLIDFPVFNVADIYVTTGCILLALLLLFYYREDELPMHLFKKSKQDSEDTENE